MSVATPKRISALAALLILPAAALAQAPLRPGLNFDFERESRSHNDTSEHSDSRNDTGNEYQTDGLHNANLNSGFQYVSESSTGPDDLANGLSNYNSGIMTRAGEQLEGNYGSMTSSASLPSGQIQEAWNRPFENMGFGQSAPGSIRYQWTSDHVMPIRLRTGMVTSIILPEWEAAQDVVIGDGRAVEATILRPNQIAVKSVSTGIDTSMSVNGGSGNVYTFYLRTEGRNTRVLTDLQVFVQAEPSRASGEWFNSERRIKPWRVEKDRINDDQADDNSDLITLPRAASQGDEPVPMDRRVFNLKMFEVKQGDRIIAPEYAYTDNRFTYLHFPAGVTDRPAVFRIVGGIEGRVNTRVSGRHGEVIVIEALGDFILRSGTRSVCIVTVDEDGNPIWNRGHGF
ncbi:MAG: TrbG/VirB9 family P-type conjugative transfer protein [Roseovarius sp.]|nr:TrbG/VirB9 family P-type conjugative transfer protein [Roseovarius sp.]